MAPPHKGEAKNESVVSELLVRVISGVSITTPRIKRKSGSPDLGGGHPGGVHLGAVVAF